MTAADSIVYSTGPGGPTPPPPRKQSEPIRISFKTGHKGSGITLIERLPMHPGGKDDLLRAFKKRLGVGGTVKLGCIELQGDHRDVVETELKGLGYKVRRIGG